MIYQVRRVRKLLRIFRLHRGLILRCVVVVLMIYLFTHIFGHTRPERKVPDYIYKSIDHPTIYTVNQEVVQEQYDDIPQSIHVFTDNVPSTEPNDIAHIDDKDNLSAESKTVDGGITHGCPEWFEKTKEGNLKHIANYPRAKADSYWRYIGGNFTSPISQVINFPVIIRRVCSICEIRKFQFNNFPDHIKPDMLKNYAWKPLIIRKVLSEYSWVWWMDASIQFKSNDLQQPLDYSIENSMLFFTAGPSMSVAKHTHPKTFEFLQEDKCKFNNLGEVTAGFVLYHYDDVTRTVVDSWAACALNEQCISPDDALDKIDCSSVDDVTKTDSHHVCHRFDQSILGILLRRLFHNKNYYPDVTNQINIYIINRLEFYYMSDEDVPYYYANKLPSYNSINRH
ncbi:hypothetical protein ACF0H5_013216 [Mactra antiquata]